MIPKKSLGQNFLTSEAAIHKIVIAAELNPSETVLEVGPGKGVLTRALLATGARVTAVEKDSRLIETLTAEFSGEIVVGRLTLIEADILEATPEKIGLAEGQYKIVANIPYYITGQFVRAFLEAKNQPKSAVILLQKEVVDRIIARDSKESILSISVKAYGIPEKIGTVSRGSFFPAPNVDSAILKIDHISKKFFDTVTEEKFFTVVRAGFAHKRKLLTSNLVEIPESTKNKADIEQIFADCGLTKSARAEDLTLAHWKKIAEKI